MSKTPPDDIDRKTLAGPAGSTSLSGKATFRSLGRGRYPLQAAVRGYIKFLKGTIAGQTKSASSNRAQDARAAEIELRIAREDRRIVDMGEAVAALDRVTGDFLQAIGGLPARITREPRERQRIEAIIDTGRQRLSDKFDEMSNNLRAGLPDDEPDDEEDS
ncbi:hypothetical protein [Mesorhizobium sp. NZP2234]|uniref:hypothetical protein n=1 Tax=Mesorhizobium sp. NZP2234 TaxID=2483402 RepID=UPI0015534147|nr:hypothetical protein [Mesorhizobium sp. NZP2234]